MKDKNKKTALLKDKTDVGFLHVRRSRWKVKEKIKEYADDH